MNRIRDEDGLTFIEILVAVAIFAVVLVASVTFFNNAFVFVRRLDERRFASQRAMQMMEELRSFVESGAENQVDLLDDFDDQGQFNPILTTEKGLKDPTDPLSGNVRLQEGWRFYRQIQVESLQAGEAKDLRRVSIKIYQSADGQPGGEMRADIAGIFRTLSSPSPPTQVMDTYVLALENVPGWWVNMATLRPLVESALSDLEAANPGLKFRTHWITRLSYGRDRSYRPQINSEEIASDGLNQTYVYPGRINRQGFWYYSPELIRGQYLLDQEQQNFEGRLDDDDLSSYSLADQYNSALRYPDELRIFQKRKEAGFDPEPSLRLLLDDMVLHPDLYRNALVVNLHGELLPLPPVRNYSDAAKSPRRFPGARVVTHPEELRVERFQPIRLRVYAYSSEPGAGVSQLEEGVSILIRGVRDVGPIRVQKFSDGGLTELETEKIGERIPEGLLLNLEKVPLRNPQSGGHKLYGLEYIPSPTESAADFSRNLSSKTTEPKNTARYVITIPSSAVPDTSLLTIETRIGRDNIRTGSFNNEPENLSRTYVWIGEDPPPSEQFQFQGDPRHSPYADQKRRAAYNWYFRRVSETGGYEGYDQTEDGWSKEAIDLDVPRYFSWFRTALVKTQAVFTTMTGFSFYYVGIGGEIGSDRPNGFPDGLPIAGSLYGERGVHMNRAMTDGVETVRSAKGDWFAIPWVGELYPDRMIPTWQRTGNLPAGEFIRAPWSRIGAAGDLGDRRRRTEVWGSASFFNATGKGPGPFNHVFSAENIGSATKDGEDLGDLFHFPIENEIKAIRPFTLDAGMNYPPEWKTDIYGRQQGKTELIQSYYSASNPSSAESSALVHLWGPATTDSAYFVINGLSPAGETGTNYIGRYALLSLMQGYLRAGSHPVSTFRIPQLPRVEIVVPKESADFVNPSVLSLEWNTEWKRWDEEPYSREAIDHAEEFAQQEVIYALKYSPDDGRTWYAVQNDAEVSPGERPSEDLIVRDTRYDWEFGGRQGAFLLRVEAFRPNVNLHYAFHQVGFSVTK